MPVPVVFEGKIITPQRLAGPVFWINISPQAAREIGRQLEDARAAHGLSRIDAARVLKVRRQMVYNYEKGKCLPSLEILTRAASAWGVTFELGGCKILPGKQEGRTKKRPNLIQQALPFLGGVREADVEVVSVGPAGRGILQVKLKIHFPNSSAKASIIRA